MADTPDCPYCEEPTVLSSRISTVRRGDKSIKVRVDHWDCPICGLGFEDIPLMQSNQELIEKSWAARFGEDIPKGRQIRRKSESG